MKPTLPLRLLPGGCGLPMDGEDRRLTEESREGPGDSCTDTSPYDKDSILRHVRQVRTDDTQGGSGVTLCTLADGARQRAEA